MFAIGSTNEAWLKPAERPEHVDVLVNSVDRYNPQNLETLQAYLDQQVQENFHDGLVNLATLKLYQFNPSEYNHEAVIKVLIKALLAVPYPDFKLSLALLGEAPIPMNTEPAHVRGEKTGEGLTEATQPKLTSIRQVSEACVAGNIKEPLIQRLAHLHLLLSHACFAEFWQKLQSEGFSDVRVFTDKIPGFVVGVQRIVLDTVSQSFKRVSSQRLARYLNVDATHVAGFVAKLPGWSVEADQVSVPSNANNEIKAVTVNEHIEVEQLHKLLRQAQPAPVSVLN